MSGWYEFYRRPEEKTRGQRLYQAWLRWGRDNHTSLDQRGSSPVFVGKALEQAIRRHPEWQSRLLLEIYGCQYPASVTQRVLSNENIEEVIAIHGVIPHTKGAEITQSADLLLIALPARPDGSPGSRISVKTYEYLTTDRPILAAVPKGENWDYLQDKPGVWLVEPTDIEGMTQAITEIAEAHFSGSPLRYDRSFLKDELSYKTRAEEFGVILRSVLCTNFASPETSLPENQVMAENHV